MNRKGIRQLQCLTAILLLFFGWANVTQAQTTAFTYQGRLADAGNPANGTYDFQFKLFDAATGGMQIGMIPSNGVMVSNSGFTVTLDFGANAFPGAARWLEISVRQGAAAFTTLSPRQPVSSTPYAIRTLVATAADSLSSTCVGCVNSTQIGTLPANSDSYIQNTNNQQAASNFNISGNGTAGGTLSGASVNATTQYNLGGSRLVSAPGTNSLFVGLNAAATGPTGIDNTYVGNSAGNASTMGDANSFFGVSAGYNNQGSSNSFFGRSAGFQNTAGQSNSFFGVQAGRDTCGAGCNASSGAGSNNSFFGRSAGVVNTTGSNNTYLGANAGNLGLASPNQTGSNNTVLGANTGFLVGDLAYATVIGAGAVAAFNNTVQLGRGGIDRVNIGALFNAAGTMTPVCVADLGVPQAGLSLSYCTSSRRYKTQVQTFRAGLSLVRRLRPVSFQWKSDGTSDLGLIAEEVAAVEPLLNTYDRNGEIEGVKYEQLTVVLINAVKEQQAQIETLRAANAALQARLRAVERAMRRKTRPFRRR